MSASERLFGAPIRPELDPAQLLNELRALRPLIDKLARLEPLILALEGLNIADVQALQRAIGEQDAVAARLEHAGAQLHRIEELLALLDELEVLVRRQ